MRDERISFPYPLLYLRGLRCERMKKICRAGILVAAVIVFAGFACIQYRDQNPQRYEGQFFDCFDTVTTVTGYADSQQDFSEKLELLQDRLVYYHQLYDIYHTYDGVNNLKTINDNAGVAPVKVEAEILNLLKLGKEMYDKTEGRLHIAYGSVLSLWHEYREEGLQDPRHAKLPPQAELDARAGHIDIEKVILDEQSSTVYLADAQMSLDVGSIGKGYAVKKLAAYAREIGLEHALISVGGNVCAVGSRADGTPWRVGIENPTLDSEKPYLAAVGLSAGCLVTSGDYQRYYEVDGERYCHIIDPKTNMPPQYFASVSVQAEDSGVADALSTSLFNMEYAQGVSLVEDMEGVEAMWVGKDGEIRYSSGFKVYEEK